MSFSRLGSSTPEGQAEQGRAAQQSGAGWFRNGREVVAALGDIKLDQVIAGGTRGEADVWPGVAKVLLDGDTPVVGFPEHEVVTRAGSQREGTFQNSAEIGRSHV